MGSFPTVIQTKIIDMIKSHKEYAETYAKNMVDEFVNHPEYRGTNFTFGKLPDMVMRFARTQSCLGFVKIQEHESNQIGIYAKAIAEQMLKEKQLICLRNVTMNIEFLEPVRMKRFICLLDTWGGSQKDIMVGG